MTVYFTASIFGKRYYLDQYLEIIDCLKSKNLGVICDHIINTSEIQISQEKRDDRFKFHQQLEKWINSCDFVVVEATYPSISVGYEISLSLSFGKPVLVLYTKGNPPSLLAEFENDKLICKKYTFQTLNSIIDEFTAHVQEIDDVKFTFFITPEIASFLDKTSTKENLPKSVYLRKLIQEDMRNHQIL